MSAGETLDGRFKLAKQIGKGSFSAVFLAVDQSDMKKVAVKVLSDSLRPSQEVAVLTDLQRVQGVPRLLSSGNAGPHFFIAMEKMHCDLFTILKKHKRLSVPAVLWVAAEMIKVLERVHESGYLHLDIKPDNIAIKQRKGKWECYLLDFGLAEKYMLAGSHYTYSENSKLRGNQNFASSGMLVGVRPSRRDDLESLVYTLAFLANGRLPWAGLPKDHNNISHVLSIRGHSSSQAIFGSLPHQIVNMLSLIKSLRFAEKPDYSAYQHLLAEAAESLGVDLSDCREWEEMGIEGTWEPTACNIETKKRLQSKERVGRDTLLNSDVRVIGFTSRRPNRLAVVCGNYTFHSADTRETEVTTFRGRRERTEATIKLPATTVLKLPECVQLSRKSDETVY